MPLKIVILLVAFTLTAWSAKPPNIIVVLVDDMGYSDLGSFGGEVRTPHLDTLAANGLRFTQNYNSARCCPSRASLLTGLYSHQAGIANFTGRDSTARSGPAYLGRLNKQCVTLAEVLKTAGYSTWGVGKWHVGHTEQPTDRGFDEYYGYTRGHSTSQWKVNNYRRLPEGRENEISYASDDFFATDAFNDYAVEFIRQAQQKSAPFFLYLAHSSPHFPLHAPAATRDSYVELYRKGWDALRQARYERQKASGLVTDSWRFTELSEVPVDGDAIANHFAGKQNPAWADVAADRREDLAYRMATFAAMIDHVDQGIGRMVEQLKKGNDLDNTLILFTSDNGACYEWGPYGFDQSSRRGFTKLHTGDELQQVGGPGTYHSVGSAWSCLSNTPLRMYKHFNHEGGNCSPLIAYWPAGIQQPDRWVRAPIHLIDIMPTICELSGASYPTAFDGESITPQEGRSLTPFLKGAESAEPRTLCFDHFDSSAIRHGDWKLVRGNRRYKNRTWELYNIAEDRCETRNLIAAQPEKAAALEARWVDWANRVKVAPYYTHKPAVTEKPKSRAIKPDARGEYLFKQGDQVESTDAPSVAGRGFTLTVTLTRGKTDNGVLMSHGGNRFGYALYLKEGKVALATRHGTELSTISADSALPTDKVTLVAQFTTKGEVTLSMGGTVLAQGKAPGLIRETPQDPLEIGNDSLSTVGNYRSPVFKGQIHRASITLSERE